MQQSVPQNLKKAMVVHKQYRQERYRWVIIAVAASAMILNGLLNNIIIPIAHKLSLIYGTSSSVINIPIILSFLVFSIVNVPANYFLDRKGIKNGFKVGLFFYVCGMVFVSFINAALPLLLIGYIIFSFGQPFIINTPAKIATYWFFPQNRALATSILVGSGIIGSGLGFVIPALVVSQDSEDQIAKNQVFDLYMGYTLAAGMFMVLAIILMKKQPKIPPSNIVKKEQLTLRQTYEYLKDDKNLWKFFPCYWMVYGSFQTFASSANLLIKPFGATDLDISLAAIMLICFGVVGAVLGSLYLKKYRNYRLLFRVCFVGAAFLIILLAFQLGVIQSVTLIKINVGILGMFITPIIPTSYQIGCQIAFPIGQAQVTGILNGGSLVWAFISDSLLTLIIGFGSKTQSMVFISVLVIFIVIGNVLCFLVKVDLKRKRFQEQSQRDSSSTRDSSVDTDTVRIQMTMPVKTDSSESKQAQDSEVKYADLNEQNL